MSTLSKAQLALVMDEAKSELLELLITRKHPVFKDGEEWDYYLECEICGLLKITRRTLMTWRVPRYPVPPSGKIVYYRLSEVKAFLKSLREK